ncbi:MAG TPA: F420H2 dehydrogenase subunit FpoO [Methanosarcina sp.]|nr:F420H2 dehydrogenase subunit FpoO [Methanosarcina sp.]
MTDCDLCGRALPSVIPVRVFRPLLKFAYPEGVWKGLCETCLDSAQKTYLSIDKDEISCRRNKCVLCGKKGRVCPVEIQIPNFSKGIVKRDVNVCTNCLESINKTYIMFKREQIELSVCGEGCEHVHEH